MDMSFSNYDNLPDYLFCLTDNLRDVIISGVKESQNTGETADVIDKGAGLRCLNCVALIDCVKYSNAYVIINVNICSIQYDANYSKFITRKFSSHELNLPYGKVCMFTNADIGFMLWDIIKGYTDFSFFCDFNVISVSSLVHDNQIRGYRFNLCEPARDDGKCDFSVDVDFETVSDKHFLPTSERNLVKHGDMLLTSDEWIRKKEVWNISDDLDAVKYLLVACKRSGVL